MGWDRAAPGGDTVLAPTSLLFPDFTGATDGFTLVLMWSCVFVCALVLLGVDITCKECFH